MKTYITNDRIIFGSPDHYSAWIPLSTGVLTRDHKASDDEFLDATWLSHNWILGQVIACPDGNERSLGRPDAIPKRLCYEVTLAAPGNPDHGQYAPIAPGMKARGSTLEEITKSCRDYITTFDLGGGNWGRRSGIVSQYSENKSKKLVRKKIGYVKYGGRYETIAERKKFEEMMVAKYGPLRTT